MTYAKAPGVVAQRDAIVHHHAPCLSEDATAFASGVVLALTAGKAAEPSRTNYSWHDEERGESDILKWRENSYVATVQSERTHLTYFTKKHLRWFPVAVTDFWWCLRPGLYGRDRQQL